MKKKFPLVSVGIPTYNRPQGLRRTLECIRGQTYKNLEIIISDNCSPGQETEMVAKEFVCKDSRIQYFRQPENRGMVFNFSFVLEKATGEYFMWAADDDAWDKNFISRCVEVLNEDPTIVLCYTRSRYITNDGKFLGVCPDSIDASLHSPLLRFVNVINQLYCCNSFYGLIRRSALLKFLPFKCFLGADHPFLAEFSLIGRLYQIQDILFFRGVEEKKETLDEYIKRVFLGINLNYNKIIDIPYLHMVLEHFNIIQRSSLELSEKIFLIREVFECVDRRWGEPLRKQIRAVIDFVKNNKQELHIPLALEALKLLNRALFLYPTLPDIQFARAICLERLGDKKEAKAALLCELFLYPDNTESQALLEHLEAVTAASNHAETNTDICQYNISQYTLQFYDERTKTPEFQSLSFDIKACHMDIVGVCNLRCPSCPQGRRRKVEESSVFMSLELFKEILSKLKSDYPQLKDIGLYNWGEPLLHPNLPEMIEFANSLVFDVGISSNLNKTVDFHQILEANPKKFVISASGYYQKTYGHFHRGGNIEKVKKNMKLLSLAKKETGADTYIYVYYYKYKNNLKEMKLMEDYAKTLGFDFVSCYAVHRVVEDLIDITNNYRKIIKDMFITNEYLLPVLPAMEIGKKYKRIPCRLLYEQIALTHEGKILQCCGFRRGGKFGTKFGVIGDYLSMSPDEIATRRLSNPVCASCISVGLSSYVCHPTIDGLREEYDNLVNSWRRELDCEALELYRDCHQETLKYFENILATEEISDDFRAQAILALANCYSKQGKFKEAEQILKEALSLEPLDENIITLIHYALGSNYERGESLEKAEEEFKEVVKSAKRIPFLQDKNRFSGGAHFHLGSIYQKRGEESKARHHFEECLKSIPDHRKAKEKLRTYFER